MQQSLSVTQTFTIKFEKRSLTGGQEGSEKSHVLFPKEPSVIFQLGLNLLIVFMTLSTIL